ncbi:MAG: hypoxanthine phosphoribosyltransferase [Acutalibacteraceae bacterium]
MDKDIECILFTSEQIDEMVKSLAKRVDEDYKDKDLVLIGLLKGSFIFMADLTKSIKSKCKVDFIDVSSYGAGTESTGRINIIKDLSDPIENKDVLIVEDIIDSGNTLSFMMDYFKAKKARSVEICTLFNKPSRREKDVYVKYIGADIEDYFIVGYGLDYAEYYRNLPYVGILKPSVYS